MVSEIIRQIETVPEYFIALKAAVAVLAMGLPLYAGLWYFSHRRNLKITVGMTLNFMGVFILFSILSFLLASPLAAHIPGRAISAYLFLTCIAAALGVLSLIDVFFLQYYLSSVKNIYISPPMRTIIKMVVFCTALLLILRYVLHFNPLALVAIPTIATAGIALAMQDTLKTFIAGLSLANIIRIGEWISFQDKEGRVVDINWARTVLRNNDNNYFFIPNALLQAGVFQNFTTGDPTCRVQIKIGASYDAPPSQVKQVLTACAENVPGLAVSPRPLAAIVEYAESSVIYGLSFWLEDFSRRLVVQDEVTTRIWYAFRREGIEIPYPVRTVYMKPPADATKEKMAHVSHALHQWALAQAFYPEELKELEQFAQTRSYARGETIVTEGDSGQSLFVVVAGTVGIYKAEHGQKKIAALGPGEIFGEMSLLTGAARSASVRAEEHVEVLEIEKAGLQTILTKRPELSNKLAELMVKRQTAPVGPASAGVAAEADGASDATNLSGRIRKFFGL